MLQTIELDLLTQQLEELQESNYFDEKIREHCGDLYGALVHLRDNPVPDYVRRGIIQQFWITIKYLRGSSSSEVPYEMQYCLNLVLDEWRLHNRIIVTALSPDRDFHINLLDPWQLFRATYPTFSVPTKNLVHLALPRMYRSHPLLNAALYHEVGHYVDNQFGVTNTTFMQNSTPLLIKGAIQAEVRSTYLPEHHQTIESQIEQSHRAEIFADLFAACYVGSTVRDYLASAIGRQPPTATHPSTDVRTQTIDDLLDGNTNSLVNLFDSALHARSCPALRKFHEEPYVDDYFDDLRPVDLSSKPEVHGLVPAAWAYIEKMTTDRCPLWAKAGPEAAFHVINGLSEKSIRNFDISSRWDNVTS